MITGPLRTERISSPRLVNQESNLYCDIYHLFRLSKGRIRYLHKLVNYSDSFIGHPLLSFAILSTSALSNDRLFVSIKIACSYTLASLFRHLAISLKTSSSGSLGGKNSENHHNRDFTIPSCVMIHSSVPDG